MIFGFDTLKHKLEYKISLSTCMPLLPQGAFQVIELIPYPDIFLEFPYTVAISRLYTKSGYSTKPVKRIYFSGKEGQLRKQKKTAG